MACGPSSDVATAVGRRAAISSRCFDSAAASRPARRCHSLGRALGHGLQDDRGIRLHRRQRPSGDQVEDLGDVLVAQCCIRDVGDALCDDALPPATSLGLDGFRHVECVHQEQRDAVGGDGQPGGPHLRPQLGAIGSHVSAHVHAVDERAVAVRPVIRGPRSTPACEPYGRGVLPIEFMRSVPEHPGEGVVGTDDGEGTMSVAPRDGQAHRSPFEDGPEELLARRRRAPYCDRSRTGFAISRHTRTIAPGRVREQNEAGDVTQPPSSSSG